ncbi:FAD-dependent oxidoreductase [Thermodesulfobacteriota bacterium]
MMSLKLKGLNRRRFLKVSALWTTAAALSTVPVPAKSMPRDPNAKCDAIVIGSGLGGLSFAGYMAKNGFKVLVLEQHNIPGGYATTFTRDGGNFMFEVSLHQLFLGGVTKEILDELGVLKKVKFRQGTNLFRLVSGDLDVTCPTADSERFEETLISMFPRQKTGIEGFMAEMLGLSQEVEKFFEAGKLTLVGKMGFPLRYPKMWAARNKSLSDYLNKYISDPKLKAVLSVFCGYFGLPPDRLSGFYYLNASGGYFRYGGFYPHGGSQEISNALTQFIRDKGGEVRLSTKVEEVLVKGDSVAGVKTADGEIETARAVVGNCSAVSLLGKMVPGRIVPRDFGAKVRALKPSISSFVVWLGLNRDITNRIKDSHIFLESERNPDKAFQYALNMDSDKTNIGVCIYNNIYKGYSPPGTSNLSITVISGYEPWKSLEKDYWDGNKEEYHRKKKEIAQALIRRVEKTLIPNLSKMIIVQDAATPLTNMRYTLNTAGAIYGFEQTPENSFMNRISNRTPIKGLYLSSAWGEPGGGYTGVLIAGKRAFGLLMEDWGKA